jgi:hypothetical protein
MLQRAWALTYLCTGSARASGVDTVKCSTLFYGLKMRIYDQNMIHEPFYNKTQQRPQFGVARH